MLRLDATVVQRILLWTEFKAENANHQNTINPPSFSQICFLLNLLFQLKMIWTPCWNSPGFSLSAASGSVCPIQILAVTTDSIESECSSRDQWHKELLNSVRWAFIFFWFCFHKMYSHVKKKTFNCWFYPVGLDWGHSEFKRVLWHLMHHWWLRHWRLGKVSSSCAA